jgi:hypothetical protein
MRAKSGRQAGIGALVVAFCVSVSATEIYRAENADGSFSYASSPLNFHYVLYLKSSQKSERKTFSKISARTFPSVSHLHILIEHYARKHQVEPDLMRAIAEVESAFNSHAVSPKGATGVMQLMPATAARYGVTRRTNPAQNIEAGVRYLKDLLLLHQGNVALALAAYNAGEGAVARHGRRIPPYPETMLYVSIVLNRLQALRNASSP